MKEEIAKVSKKYADSDGRPKSLASYKLVYQSDSNQLEPVYFWIVDFMQGAGIKVEKIVDNFSSSPGSGHFSDMQQKESRLRQEAMSNLGAINQVVKSVIQLLYDLKEFEQRLEIYEKAKDKDKITSQGAIMNLKQVWLDQVDMKKGNTSIKALAFGQSAYATLIDAFMVVDNEKLKDSSGNTLDLNERTKRLLQQRIQEFNIWRKLSQVELEKRFNVQKAYLKSQVETIKLYTRWATPYIKAAKNLEMKGFDKHPALVNAFSTTMFEITVMGESKTDIKRSADLTKKFKDYKLNRDYKQVFLVSFNYRGELAQKVNQRGDYGFGYGGKLEVTFDCYALNSEELELIKKNFQKEEDEASLDFIRDNTEVSLEELREELEYFLGDNKKEESKKTEKTNEDDINPFTALIDLFRSNSDKKPSKKNKIEDVKDIKTDNFVEKEVRKEAESSAKKLLYAVYDVYKKAHGMASSPENFEN